MKKVYKATANAIPEVGHKFMCTIDGMPAPGFTKTPVKMIRTSSFKEIMTVYVETEDAIYILTYIMV